MFGGGAGGGNFGASTQQGQGSSGAFGGRGGGFGGAAGRGFGGINAGGAFTGRMLFGAPLPSAGQGSAPVPVSGSGNAGGPRETRGGAAGGTAAAASGGQQQRGPVMPGRGVYVRLGIPALREGANLDSGGGGGSGAAGHAAGGGRGRGGGPHGVASGGRQGFGGFGYGRGGRGTGRGGGRTWQQQQQHGGRRFVWIAGTQAAAGGGGDMRGEEVYDDDGAGDDGAAMEFDGLDGADPYIEAPEDAGGGGGDGEPATTTGQPGDWRSGRAVALGNGQSQPIAAGRAGRAPVPLFNEKRAAGGDGSGDAATDDDDAARLKRRQRRFGQTADVAGAAAAGGATPGTGFGAGALGLGSVTSGDATPPRGASRSPACFQVDTEAEPDIRGHSPSPSPPPGPSLAYLGGGGDGMGDDDDGVAGGGAALVGTCELMCPVAERKRREATGELNIFERLDPHNSKLTNENLIIKKARKNYSEEDRRPENLRTFRALGLTMARLRSLIAAPDETALAAAIQCSPEQTLLNVQAFLWDRYREVRKEIIAQHFHTRAEMLPQVLAWNEEIARFLIISSHELWGNRDFAAQLNQEQLKKVLTDLVTRFYTSASRLGVPKPNSAEIKCYLLILMMGGTIEKNGRRFRQPAEAQMYLRQYTQEELESPWTDVLFAVMATLQSGNAIAFFDLMARAPYTLACICASHVMPMRSLAMHMMAAAMGGPHLDQPGGRRNPDAAIPLSDLARVLKLSEVNTSSYAEMRQALVQPGGATGQRDVSFLSSHVTAREPRAKPQHWISSKRARQGRSQDTVNAAELSPELLNYCRLVLAGSSSSPVSHLRPMDQLATAAGGGGGGLRSPVQGAAAIVVPLRQTPLTAATAGVRPPLPTSAPTSPSPWEYSPEVQGGAGAKAGGAMAAGGTGLYGSTAGLPGPAREARREGISPARAANIVFGSPTLSAGAPTSAATVASPTFAGFGTAAAAAATPAVVTAPAGVTGGFSIAGATTAPPPFSQQSMQQQQQQQQLLSLQQQQQQQQVQSGFGGVLQTIQYPSSHPSPNMVDAGLLAQAQRAAEVERQARESLRHQADQAIRQEHERNRALMMQFEQVAASATATQAALLAAQQRAAAYAREVQSLRLEKQEEEIEKQWRDITVRRCVGKWREAAQQRKRRQEVLRQQLARVSVTFNGAWARSPLNLLRRGGSGSSGREELEAKLAAEQSPTGRKRRFGLLAPNGGVPTSRQAAASTEATVFRARNGTLTPHLNLEEVILPGLCRAIAKSQGNGPAAAGNGSARSVRYGSFRSAAGAAKHGFRRVEEWELGNRKWLDPALQRHVFWKMLLVSGAQEMEAHCISGFQLEAASWIRARLSCGRAAGPRPNRQLELGEQLTIEGARVVVCDQACNLTMCVQDIRATSLPSGGSSAAAGSFRGFGGRDTPVVLDAAKVATALAATSGVMMLVDGRMFETALAEGSSPQRAAVKAAQDLNESWERLRSVLSNLPDTRSTQQSKVQSQGPAQLPVVILTLGSSASTTAVGNHLASVAAMAWPPAVAARLLASPPFAGSTAALGGHVKVLSLAEAPDEALRLSLSFMTESAPLYEHVVCLDLEELARGAVAEVVSELDQSGPATATAAATIAAYNHLLTVYEAAVMATAASPSARWGLPAPEVSVSDFDAAPACWAPERISAVVSELRCLQLPPPSPEQSKLPGGSAVLPQLLGRVATWSVATARPRKVMMLAALAPSLRRQLRMRVGAQPLTLTLSLPAPADTAAHGTPARRPWEPSAAAHCTGNGLDPEQPAAQVLLHTPVGMSASGNGAGASAKGSLVARAGPASSATPPGYVTLMADVMATPTGAPLTYGPAGAGWESGSATISVVRSPPYGFGGEKNLGMGNEGPMAEVPVSETKRMATEALKALLAALGS
ncbi:hypothetical protein Vretimale_1255 [Volvox reticuliferus]|uniref:SAC3/GANP/THP3 conserved domain-containing protein n=1 Tax=Volvox reticuliferus TaxID=1737510 RepID=A0A8J4FLS4_9CHLO|nr:hypothetical protein Vretifemale_10603 [Volvox reticuliferus]GIL95166.1 hypothetical protein Vretimale_1255 [Volvox reticuliferus]